MLVRRAFAGRRFLSTTTRSVPPIYFPYGKSDFRSIRRSGQFFGDFSGHIRPLEAIGEQLIFTRPPRWGKSIFQDMLSAYYDKNTTEAEFHELFGELDICKEEAGPTPFARRFHVLPIDLGVSVEDPARIEQNMFNKINIRIDDFAQRYDLKVRIVENDANASLMSLALAVQRENGLLYLLVDEYDRFANKLMFEDPERYHHFVGTPGSSPLRSFLETVKEVKPARTFITGITTIALADASGANSFRNISFEPQLGTMVGFTEEIVRRGLGALQLSDTQGESAMQLMHAFFDGFRFPGVGDDTPLFNSQQCLFFLLGLASGKFLYLLKNDTWKQTDPYKLINIITDPNTRISDNVFGVLGNTPISLADIVSLASSPVPCSIAGLSTPYRLKEMIGPTSSTSSDDPNVLLARSRAFMFSHGIVTLAPDSHGDEGKLIVPNEIARQDYLKKLEQKIGLRAFDLGRLFQDPTAETIRSFFQSIVNEIGTAHDANFSEGALQGTLESWLKAMQLMAPRYKVFVEAKHDGLPNDTQGYSDLLLIDPSSNIVVLVELERIRLQYVLNEQKQAMFRGIDRWNLAECEEHIDKMELDQLLALRSQKREKQRTTPTIRESLERKKQQLTRYEGSLLSMGFATGQNGEHVATKDMDIYSFAVVQVGRRLIVEDMCS